MASKTRASLSLRTLNLRRLVTTVLQPLKMLAARNGSTLRCVAEEVLPSALVADACRLTEALVRLFKFYVSVSEAKDEMILELTSGADDRGAAFISFRLTGVTLQSFPREYYTMLVEELTPVAEGGGCCFTSSRAVSLIELLGGRCDRR